MAKKFPTSLEDENEPNHVPAQTPERPIPHSREDRLSPLPHQESPQQTPNVTLRRNSVGYNGARPRSSSFRARRPSEDVRVRRRRVDSLNLETPYHFDYDPTTNRYPLEPEAYIEGQELYLHFFHEQVRNAGLAEDFCLEEDFNLSRYHVHGVHTSEQAQPLTNSRRQRTMSMNLQNFSDPVWRQTGSELRALADAFQASPGRVRVRQRAEQVDVSNLDMEKFWALLKGLFEVT